MQAMPPTPPPAKSPTVEITTPAPEPAIFLGSWSPELGERLKAARRQAGLTRISHHLTTEAHDRPAIPSLRLLAVLNAGSTAPALVKRRAPPADAPLTHFASPRGEKSGLNLNQAATRSGLSKPILIQLERGDERPYRPSTIKSALDFTADPRGEHRQRKTLP